MCHRQGNPGEKDFDRSLISWHDKARDSLSYEWSFKSVRQERQKEKSNLFLKLIYL